MSVVEEGARSLLALVFGDDQGLRRDTPKDHPLEHRAVGVEKAGAFLLQEDEKASVHGNGVLYNLAEIAPVAHRWQCLDSSKGGNHSLQLPHLSDLVLRRG